PRGAIAVAEGGTDPSDTIGQIMVAIKERYAHSMISHGPSSVSHATRTMDIAQADEWNGNCTSPLASAPLKQGPPGAERATTSGLYSFLYNTDSLSVAHSDVKYYDAVQWTTWIAGECKNPKVNYADGSITCDPIKSCTNPHTSLQSPSNVLC